MAKKKDDKIVNINLYKHGVVIVDELVVNIKHNKDCSKPCPSNIPILNYLLDELFLAEGFVVTDD